MGGEGGGDAVYVVIEGGLLRSGCGVAPLAAHYPTPELLCWWERRGSVLLRLLPPSLSLAPTDSVPCRSFHRIRISA